jgi:polyhydroxybutyrate depolymerase
MSVPRRARCLLLATLLLASAGAVEGASPSADPTPLPSPAPACTNLVPGEYAIHVDVDGITREVLLHVPSAVEQAGARVPLAIGFHGYSAYAWQLAETAGLGPAADADGFIIAYPQGLPDGPWPPNWYFPGNPTDAPAGVDEIRLVEVILDQAAAEGCIDTERVVAFGHSMGGGMTDAVACALADRLAGAVLVSAVQFGGPCEPARPVPIEALHAVDDDVLPYAGGHIPGTPASFPGVLAVEPQMARWAARNGCTGGPVVSEQPDGGAIMTWEGCAAPVVLHRLPSGGHAYAPLASRLVREMIGQAGTGQG